MKDMIKDKDDSQTKRYMGQGLKGSQVWELLSLWGLSVPHSQYVDVFANLETP